MKKLDAPLLQEIMNIKQEHPAWGYRRIWAYLNKIKGHKVNHKKIHRLMKINNLLIQKSQKLKALRENKTRKPKTDIPHRIWGIDMTKTLINNFGYVYLHIVIDWGSKKIVGCTLSVQSKTSDWLYAIDQAILMQFPNGYKEFEYRADVLYLVSDNGCQPTSKKFKDEIIKRDIKQIFTSFCNPKGNADTERVIRTIKEDLIWINEWESYEQLEVALKIWVKKYNEKFPHMTLNYQTPVQYEQAFSFYYDEPFSYLRLT